MGRGGPSVPGRPTRRYPAAMILLVLACGGPPADDTAPTHQAAPEVPWDRQVAPLVATSPGGRTWQRGIIHLHSHFSHDACDNDPMPGGVPSEPCLQSLRDALCDDAIDYAFLTDHPDYAAYQDYDTLLLEREGDERVDGIGNRMHCANGHDVLLMPGIEDELMPIGLDRQVASGEENARIYNGSGAETFDAEIGAGATVLQAHTEGQDLETLLARQALGLGGVEMFNLHAMVDPNKRADDLGLDPYDWLATVAPWLNGTTTAEPDLVFLGIYQPQDVSIARWDALSAVAPTTGTAGTDAHENSLPNPMADGERVDSYRRMMRWFSNVALVEGDGPADYQAAVASGRMFVAFDFLGAPGAWDVHYGDLEMGGTAATGDLLVATCPTLAADTPQRGDAPEITVTVFKDGAVWQEGCGEWAVTESGVYRAVATITPHHLAGFLDAETHLIQPLPWLYSNAFRIGL